MQLLFVHYNIVAFIERKLRFFCKAARIMSIMKKNYSLNFHCATYKATLGNPLAGFVF